MIFLSFTITPAPMRFSIDRLGRLGAAVLGGAALVAAPARAATPTEASAILISPLSLLRTADMDFATITVSANGTATIDPVTGALTTTGGVARVAGSVSRAEFVGNAARPALVWIQIPTGTAQLVRQGGTERLTISNFTLDRFPLQLVGRAPFNFGVGARLTVPATTVEGLYSGSFAVTINYY